MTPHHEQAVEGGHGGVQSAGVAGHGGMMSEDEMAALMAATGTDAARLSLEGMVRPAPGRHRGSDTVISDGQHATAIELAKKIKTAQAAEITELLALLENYLKPLTPTAAGPARPP